MRYAYFRDHGMFVGSGVVEAGCKAIIGQRLKLSGMRWNIPGATGILTLRCQQASGRWDQIWTQPHNQTATATTACPRIKIKIKFDLPTNLSHTHHRVTAGLLSPAGDSMASSSWMRGELVMG